MECFIALLFFGFVALLVSGVGAGLGPGSSSRAYQALTNRFGGVYQRRSLLRLPSVRFRYGLTWVTITQGPKRGSMRSTQAQIHWEDRYLDLAVEPSSPFALGQSPGRRNLTGDPSFDERFQVVTRQDAAARKLLSDGVRWQLNKLYQFFDTSLRWTIRNGLMVIEKPALLRRSEDLEQFTQLCLELFDQAMLTRSEGIEFVGDENEAQLIEDPICQVCGEEIRSEMVFCRRCRTPHHLDCWQYNGCCAIFGCRETRYAVPAVAQAIEQPMERSVEQPFEQPDEEPAEQPRQNEETESP